MADQQYEDRTIKVNRVAKVVKGGRRFSFAALMVIGDGQGTVGLGYGKAKEAGLAVQKGIEEAKKNLFTVPLAGIDHHPPGPRRGRRRPGPAQAGRARYRRHRRRRGPGHPRDGRHPRHPGQVARLVQQHQRGPGHRGRPAGAEAPRRDRPPPRQVPRGGHPGRASGGPTRRPSGAPTSRTRWPDGRPPHA